MKRTVNLDKIEKIEDDLLEEAIIATLAEFLSREHRKRELAIDQNKEHFATHHAIRYDTAVECKKLIIKTLLVGMKESAARKFLNLWNYSLWVVKRNAINENIQYHHHMTINVEVTNDLITMVYP